MTAITFTLNGEEKTLERVYSLGEFLASRGILPQYVVVEQNGEIVSRERFQEIEIKSGDVFEMVTMVGGG